MSNYRPMTNFSNPITKAGRVVYNVSLDMSHAAYRMKPGSTSMLAVPNVSQNADSETVTVQPHEICLEQNKDLFKRGLSRSVNDTEILLLSALNGLKCSRKNHVQGDPEATRRNVRKTLKFGGVASTRSIYDPSHRVGNDQVFVSQFGGLCTIQNTGDDPIYAGDFVVWDLPKREGEGTQMCGKMEKQMVITRPYRHKPNCKATMQRRIAEPGSALKSTFDEARKGGSDSADKFAELLCSLQEDLREEQARVIGRAMSNAEKPGDTFDILLGRYSA